MVEVIQEETITQLEAIDQIIATIDERLTETLAVITEHPDFEAMRGMWFGLAELIDVTDEGRHIAIGVDLLDVRKEDLLEDFDEYPDLTDSSLFYHLYKSEFDQAGGVPYGAVLMQYHFTNATPDVHLLRQISMVAAACHCPVITNASPRFFGKTNFTQLEQISDFELLFKSPEYIKWHQLCRSEDARYIGMMLPDYLARYHPPRRPPRYCRHPKLENADQSWTYASYAFGRLLIRSFIRHGWCVYLRGPNTGGRLRGVYGKEWGLPGFHYSQVPSRVTFSDVTEQEIARWGFMPLTWYPSAERLCLFSAPSIQNIASIEVMNASAAGHDRLAASLPYLFLVCRIAHYHKSIQRENVGTVKESRELEIELHKWLQKLKATQPDPSLEVRSQRPLRDGLVQVSTDDASPGFFTVKLVVQPHLQLEGVNAQLTLVSKMPRKE